MNHSQRYNVSHVLFLSFIPCQQPASLRKKVLLCLPFGVGSLSQEVWQQLNEALALDLLSKRLSPCNIKHPPSIHVPNIDTFLLRIAQ